MKNHKARKLTLNKDTVRALDQIDLAKIAGGNVTSTVQPSHIRPCP
ncbi:MAG TPA: class I lanthipeptide [Kofleriaceae bacterium]